MTGANALSWFPCQDGKDRLPILDAVHPWHIQDRGITLLNGIFDPVPPLIFPIVRDRNQAAPLQHTVAEQWLVDSSLTLGVYDLFPIRQCLSPLHSEGRYYHRFVVGQHGDYVCWIDFSRLDFCTAPLVPVEIPNEKEAA